MKLVMIGGRTFETTDPKLFSSAYLAGKTAVRRGEDTDAFLKQLLAQGDFAAANGYLQGLAMDARVRLPEHPVDCLCRRCVHDRESLMRHIHRIWREQVPA
ncbi:hypothetical protein OIU81_03255 [Streptomyces sp. NBC_01454]|uniref:hypothetical protein n=1 Tax=Streptomyces sp. NBC_01454 TaxID=2975867 RepID=UPI002E2F6F12|nr:hypothetical protein [Streptomyces sp. NBC_01454]